MSVGFPHVRVGEPVRYQSLSVFPLFDGSKTPVEYLLSDEGIGSGSVTVEEVSEAGSVPDLLVENKGDVRVLFIEGEELVGAKQNRILNTSVLIAAKSKTKIPVSCVEAGPVGIPVPAFRLQRQPLAVEAAVLPEDRPSAIRSWPSVGHRSDQGKVWEEVARQQACLGYFFRHQCHVRHLRGVRRTRWPSSGRSSSTWTGQPGWPWRSARRSSPWTCSTSRPPAGRSGTG